MQVALSKPLSGGLHSVKTVYFLFISYDSTETSFLCQMAVKLSTVQLNVQTFDGIVCFDCRPKVAHQMTSVQLLLRPMRMLRKVINLTANAVCPRPSVTLTFDRLTLKLVCESHLRWGTFIPNLGTLGLWVLRLFAVYAMDE